MSRGYRVYVEPLSVARTNVSAEDELCIQLSLLPVLGEDRMRELVREALKADGWKDDGQGGLKKQLGDGLSATLDRAGAVVTVRQEANAEVTGAGRSQQLAEQQAEERARNVKDNVKRQATTSLARAEGDVRAAVDAVIQRVYVTALEEKARSMGQLESMEQTTSADGTVEVVLKVRV